ncbi:MAG: ribose-5-phosphate isomerase RpiA [Luminiphilus sp.]|nr:ribose-5-phosphate isomerase RpiA [Luminiphilus sp.]MDG2036850.1 ribose-5-phosphate isomerase RpiA [Luminiphilus sp.]
MNQSALKELAARAAVETIKDRYDKEIALGIGTGSTAECFIKMLPEIRDRIEVTVASSERSAHLLAELDIPISDLNASGPLDVYVDGADEINGALEMIKGGGAALTREKIIAGASEHFICIADQSKRVSELGAFPLPVEVIPMARSHVARRLADLGGTPVWREGVITDNGNVVLDVHGLRLNEPGRVESLINQMVGVVTNGIFAHRPADDAFLAGSEGVERMIREVRS